MNKIKEYDVLKVITILLVIISHSTYYKISSEYGGIDYLGVQNSAYRLADKVREVIYYFHMPLFMGISGALYYKTKKKREYFTFITVKFKRLIIPFIVFTFFYTIPLKYISGYFNNISPLEIVKGQLFLFGNSHLWYLYGLFIIFSMVELIDRYNIKIEILICVAYLIHLLSYIIKLQLLSIPLTFLVWFLFGMVFEKNRKKINLILEKDFLSYLSKLTVLFLVLIMIKHFFKVNGGLSNRILLDILAMVGSILMYIIAYLCSKTNWINSALFNLILVNGLGIYIFSDTLNYVILKLCHDFLGIDFMLSVSGMLLIICIRIVGTLLMSMSITIIFKKFFPKYYWLVN